MGFSFGMLVEGSVAVLLVVTILALGVVPAAREPDEAFR